jgi:hypothetical protein
VEILLIGNINIYDFTPSRINPTPKTIQNILIKDIFSTIPQTPKVVVKISISGPIIARELLTIIAFSIELKRIIKIAAVISIPPDKNLNMAIPNTTFSIIKNIPNLLTITITFNVYVPQLI